VEVFLLEEEASDLVGSPPALRPYPAAAAGE
jgi:hypothetical protein